MSNIFDSDLEQEIATIVESKPSEGPQGGNTVKIVMTGVNTTFVEFTPNTTVGEMLGANNYALGEKNTIFQNGNEVERDAYVLPGATINIVGPMVGGA